MKKIFLLLFVYAQTATAQYTKGNQTDFLQPAVFSLTMVMMHDVVNPPAASRYYAYCTLGAYSIVAENNHAMAAPFRFIKKFPAITITEDARSYDHTFAAIYCIIETGRLMLPSGYQLKDEEDKLMAAYKSKLTPAVINQSIAVAVEVAGQVINFSKKDNYNRLSTLLRYTPSKTEGHWYPTPPTYMEAVEPNWLTIRTMILDSASQFKPLPLAPYSTDTTSTFYQLAKEVYDVSKQATAEQVDMASFWDCNPFVVSTSGHMMLGFKKMSPGGHWMNITCLSVRKAKLDFDKAVQVLALEAVTLMDAFISCWDEKYKSNRIRPETFINKHIDVRWQPLLQTPPFPEYTSGHSVISSASAELLTYFLGDNFYFTDNSEILFEIPERSFPSFRKAAEEAAISRLYGGIHYRDAIVNGQTEGKEIAHKIIDEIKAAGVKPAGF